MEILRYSLSLFVVTPVQSELPLAFADEFGDGGGAFGMQNLVLGIARCKPACANFAPVVSPLSMPL
jgi:hypothetical protein